MKNSCGLYAITPTNSHPDQLIKQVTQAILGGARIIQYRDKGSDHPRRENEARALLRLCQQYDRTLIINDDVGLAKRIGADGVHLGIEDKDVTQARTILGDNAIIGISCYNDIERAKQAVAQGASYVAFGRFFASTTKPNATLADIETLRQAKCSIDLPIVAIGGIDAENGRTLIKAGADMLAVIHSLFSNDDIQTAARKISNIF